jgi:uncharacterized protein (DUF2141 family)
MTMKLFFVLMLLPVASFAASVKLNFSQTMGKTGKVYYAVYDSDEQFPKGKPVTTGFVETSGQMNPVATVDLPAGEYAVSVFLDENGNGRLDQNVIGIPKERFGFSNNPRILTGPPSYRDCAVRVLEQNNEFDIRLIKLF